MKQSLLSALVAFIAITILACGADPSKQPDYGKRPIPKTPPKTLFNQEAPKISVGDEYKGSTVELKKDGNAYVFVIGNDAKELFETLQIGASEYAGDEAKKPEERLYSKGKIKRGDNFFCTARPLAKKDNNYVEHRCQIGFEIYWGKVAGWGNSADSGEAHMFWWGPDATQGKQQTGYAGYSLFLTTPNAQGLPLGMIMVSGADARTLYAAMTGIAVAPTDINGTKVEGKQGEGIFCASRPEANGMVSYSCFISINYARGAVTSTYDLKPIVLKFAPNVQ